MRKVIKFDDGQLAVIYKNTDIRTKLTTKQSLDFGFAKQIITIKSKNEILLIGGYHD